MKETLSITVLALFVAPLMAQDPWLDLNTYTPTGEAYTQILVLPDLEDIQGIYAWADEQSGGDAIIRHLVFEHGKQIQARVRLARTIERLRELAGPEGDAVLAEQGIVVQDDQ